MWYFDQAQHHKLHFHSTIKHTMSHIPVRPTLSGMLRSYLLETEKKVSTLEHQFLERKGLIKQKVEKMKKFAQTSEKQLTWAEFIKNMKSQFFTNVVHNFSLFTPKFLFWKYKNKSYR